MQVAIKLIPISGSASLDIKSREKEETDKFHCKFYGDLQLPTNPSTFEDAVKVYQELPQLINGKNGDTSVPKVVHLQPLSDFDGGHLRIVRSISDDLVSQVEQILQNCNNVAMRANDFRNDEVCSSFVDLESQIKSFQMLINRFKTKFKKKLASILPKIRGQGAEEIKLANLISSIQESPFNSKDLEKYLRGKGKEVKVLSQYLRNMHKISNINFFLPSRNGDLMTLTSDDDYEHVFCFAFNITSESTPYIEALEKYFVTDQVKSVTAKEWFDVIAIAGDLRSKSSNFLDFARVNSNITGFTFAVTDLNEELDASGPAIVLYKEGLPEEFEPPGKPGNLKAKPIEYDSIHLEWTNPETGADVVSYRVYYCKDSQLSGIDTNDCSNIARECVLTGCPQTFYEIKGLSAGTKYKFWVQGVCDIGALSAESDCCTGQTKDQHRPADLILCQSTLLETGSPDIYKLPVKLVNHNKDEGLFKYLIESPTTSTANAAPEKVLVILGATGAGKSTMLNGLANYVMGVKFNDSFRFKVVVDEGSGNQAHSQTKHISAYTFHSTILDYTLTVIDTPGFGDTEGIERDKKIASQIKMFFDSQDNCGIDVLHGIGFVTQSSLARLTPTQKYIFDAVLSIFGKDIVDNIFLLATFADANTPQVMAAVKEAEIPFQQCFKFNNSALFAASDNDESYLNSMFWNMGVKSFANFFSHFNKSEMKSLIMTKEVLKERQQLEILIPKLQHQVAIGLNQLDAIKKIEEELKVIKEPKEFKYTCLEQRVEKIRLPPGIYTTTCPYCNYTCHENCTLSDDKKIARCWVMRRQHCLVCPQKCHWSDHIKVPYRLNSYIEEVVKTYKSKSDASTESGKERVERILAENKKEHEDLQVAVFFKIKEVQMCTERLKEIALKPNPLTEMEYLELLIVSEKNEKKDGWKERIEQYKILMKQAEVLKTASQYDAQLKDTELCQSFKFAAVEIKEPALISEAQSST